MMTANQLDALCEVLKGKIDNGETTLSEACWTLARGAEGWPYVYGAWGALCTVSERKKRYSYNPSHTTIKTACKAFNGGKCDGCKWFPDGERVRCYDCRGFTDWVLKQFGFDLYGDTCGVQYGTASNWCAKGEVKDGIPQGVIVCLFVFKNGKFTHTGLYYNGETMEASSGVQYSAKLSTKWTHWAVAACFRDVYQSAPSAPVFDAIKKGMKGERVKALQLRLLALGYSLPRYGADGDFGKETLAAVKAFQADHGLPDTGVVDQITQDALDGANPVLYTVIVPNLTEAQADALCLQYPGAIKEERGID